MLKKGLNRIVMLCMVILFLLLPLNIAAADSLILDVADGRGSRGGKIDLVIRAENATGTEGGQFILNYDPTLVVPVAIQAGQLISSARDDIFMANLEYAPGQVMVMWVTVYGDTADSGVICTLTFDLLKEGEAELALSEVVVVADDATGQAIVRPGKIRVAAAAVSPPATTRPDEGSPPASDDEELPEEEPVDDDQIIDDEANDNEEPLAEVREDDRFLLYAVILAVLAIALSIGFAVIKKLKKPEKE